MSYNLAICIYYYFKGFLHLFNFYYLGFLIWDFRVLFSAPEVITEGLFPNVSLSWWSPLDFSLNCIQVKESWRKTCKLPSIFMVFGFWSSFSIHLVLYIFQNPTTVPPGIRFSGQGSHNSEIDTEVWLVYITELKPLPSSFVVFLQVFKNFLF